MTTHRSAGGFAGLLTCLFLTVALPSFPALAQETSENDDEAQTEKAQPGVDPQEGLTFMDTGPLRIREQFLPGAAFLAFEPTSADVLGAGQWQIDLINSGTNTWVMSDQVERVLEARSQRSPLTLEELRDIEPEQGQGLYFADGELYRSNLSIRRGLGKGLQLSIGIPVINFQGGFADSLVEDFHDATGFEQAGRLGIPEDSYTVYIRDPEGNETFRNSDPGVGLGDVTVSLKSRIPTPSESWRLSAEGTVKLPTGDEDDLYGSGSADVGVALHATKYFSRSCIHGSVGAIRLGEADVYHLDSQTRLFAMLGYEHAMGKTWSWLIEATLSQSPFEDLNVAGLDDFQFLTDVGVKKGFGENTVLFLALSENFLTFGSTADVGLHVGVTQTF